MAIEFDVPGVDAAEKVTDLWIALAEEQRSFGSHMEGAPNRERIRSTFASHIVADELVVALETEDVVGFVSFAMEFRLFEISVRRGIVHNLYVVPEYRGGGIGGRLLEEAEHRLRKRGADVVSLEALDANERVHEFYRRHGYDPHRITYEKSMDPGESE